MNKAITGSVPIPYEQHLGTQPSEIFNLCHIAEIFAQPLERTRLSKAPLFLHLAFCCLFPILGHGST